MTKFSRISKQDFDRLIQDGKIKPLDHEEGNQNLPDGIPSAFTIWCATEDETDADS